MAAHAQLPNHTTAPNGTRLSTIACLHIGSSVTPVGKEPKTRRKVPGQAAFTVALRFQIGELRGVQEPSASHPICTLRIIGASKSVVLALPLEDAPCGLCKFQSLASPEAHLLIFWASHSPPSFSKEKHLSRSLRELYSNHVVFHSGLETIGPQAQVRRRYPSTRQQRSLANGRYYYYFNLPRRRLEAEILWTAYARPSLQEAAKGRHRQRENETQGQVRIVCRRDPGARAPDDQRPKGPQEAEAEAGQARRRPDPQGHAAQHQRRCGGQAPGQEAKRRRQPPVRHRVPPPVALGAGRVEVQQEPPDEAARVRLLGRDDHPRRRHQRLLRVHPAAEGVRPEAPARDRRRGQERGHGQGERGLLGLLQQGGRRAQAEGVRGGHRQLPRAGAGAGQEAVRGGGLRPADRGHGDAAARRQAHARRDGPRRAPGRGRARDLDEHGDPDGDGDGRRGLGGGTTTARGQRGGRQADKAERRHAAQVTKEQGANGRRGGRLEQLVRGRVRLGVGDEQQRQ